MKFRAWMIESSYHYIKASRLLWENELPAPSVVNAAIGLEILFKSFMADVDGPEGGIGELYVFDKRSHGIKDHGHNLLHLFDAIPDDVKSDLNLDPYRSWISDYYPQPFIDARYPYEKSATGSYSDTLTDIAEKVLDIVIDAYKNHGCSDPWIEKYPNV